MWSLHVLAREENGESSSDERHHNGASYEIIGAVGGDVANGRRGRGRNSPTLRSHQSAEKWSRSDAGERWRVTGICRPAHRRNDTRKGYSRGHDRARLRGWCVPKC